MVNVTTEGGDICCLPQTPPHSILYCKFIIMHYGCYNSKTPARYRFGLWFPNWNSCCQFVCAYTARLWRATVMSQFKSRVCSRLGAVARVLCVLFIHIFPKGHFTRRYVIRLSVGRTNVHNNDVHETIR